MYCRYCGLQKSRYTLDSFLRHAIKVASMVESFIDKISAIWTTTRMTYSDHGMKGNVPDVGYIKREQPFSIKRLLGISPEGKKQKNIAISYYERIIDLVSELQYIIVSRNITKRDYNMSDQLFIELNDMKENINNSIIELHSIVNNMYYDDNIDYKKFKDVLGYLDIVIYQCNDTIRGLK